jgi:hypothetical protein
MGERGLREKCASSPLFEGWSGWFSQLKQIRKREMERGSIGARFFLASIPLLLFKGKWIYFTQCDGDALRGEFMIH